jgi:diguanylate cyclase (GGDEF)-like protein
VNHIKPLAAQAIRDPLTGLYNRRFMEESLENELIRAKRNGAPVSVVMCDLDHFKSVNDLYGPQAGDKVIEMFSTQVKRQCRGSDIASRYGGEEFLLVFPGMRAELAVTRAERMRGAIAEASVITAGSRTVRVTASFGVATYPADGQSWEEVVAAADNALYEAKAAGRNQVRPAQSEKTAADDGPFRRASSNARPIGANRALRVAKSA